MKNCKYCGSKARIVKTNLGYFCECERNWNLHNIGIFGNVKHLCKTPEEAEREWDKANK